MRIQFKKIYGLTTKKSERLINARNLSKYYIGDISAEKKLLQESLMQHHDYAHNNWLAFIFCGRDRRYVVHRKQQQQQTMPHPLFAPPHEVYELLLRLPSPIHLGRLVPRYKEHLLV